MTDGLPLRELNKYDDPERIAFEVLTNISAISEWNTGVR